MLEEKIKMELDCLTTRSPCCKCHCGILEVLNKHLQFSYRYYVWDTYGVEDKTKIVLAFTLLLLLAVVVYNIYFGEVAIEAVGMYLLN